jgi:chromate reductase
MKIIAFGASSSRNSINREWASYVAQQIREQKLPAAEVLVLDLNDYELPLFSVDFEEKTGPQPAAQKFLDQLATADLLVVSLAEHNGSYSVAFKNLLDWSSRLNPKPFQNKPTVLMATSPGPRGGSSVLQAAESRFPFLGALVQGTLSLPEFQKNFSTQDGLTSPSMQGQLKELISKVKV